MAWYISADQLAEHIAGLVAGMKFEQYPYLSVKVLQNLEDLVRKEPNTFRWDSVYIGDCGDCKWKFVRHQKCSCCRRNRNLKDNFEEDAE